MTTKDMRFSQNPERTICETLTWPLANTIAFGGVAMGSIKAQLDARVTGMTIAISG